jgi:acetolactate synthase-1/2/3 large subunit
METKETTVAKLLVSAFAANGVKRIFGIPGGGSSLDIMEAATAVGIDFVLTRTENAAVMMAAATAELSGTPGVALTTKGPGIANAVNGVAYAALDRAPVILLTDGFTSDQESYVTHQVFDQQALLTPLVKGFTRLRRDTGAKEITALIELALTAPFGPVQIELTGDVARSSTAATDTSVSVAEVPTVIDESGVTAASALLQNASRPVVIVGLEARDQKTAAQLNAFIEKMGCPVLATYKAKGVVADTHAQFAGVFTGGAAESECVSKADLIILCGVDPVEFVLQKWRYSAPVLDIATQYHEPHYASIKSGLYGSIVDHLTLLVSDCRQSQWTIQEIAALREQMLTALSYPVENGIGPQQVVVQAEKRALAAGLNPRITVDAGAHMFSAMAFWRCNEPCDVLISNGLATMAFALPAAIAASLHEPDRPAIAFTGDGGLLMCLGELLTAVQQKTRIIVIVLNDGSLSLIDIKQQQREMEPSGVRWEQPDFAEMMRGFGGRAFRVSEESEYEAALDEALLEQGPVLIDVLIDPTGYPQQIKALRG